MGSSYRRFLKNAKEYNLFELEKYNELVEYLKANKNISRPRKLGLKLIAISDTHGYLALSKDRLNNFMENIPEYDLCVLLGDIHPYDLAQIVAVIPKEKILAVAGNHDTFELYDQF